MPDAAPPEPLCALDLVSYYYPSAREPALRDLTLGVRRGEFLGVIGPTGAGKSTFCQLFNGVVPQFYGGRFFGSVHVDGLDTIDHPIRELARRVGMVFQDPETQLLATSVENEIAFALENLAVPREEMLRRIPEVLDAVRLAGLAHKRPEELSGGQKQRLAIAAALAARPELIVLDEPTSQLDPAGEEEVFAVLRRLNRERGVTVIVASHATEHLAAHADRVALLAAGELVALDSPAAVFGDPELLWKHQVRPPQVSETFHRIYQGGGAAPPPASTLPITLEDGLAALAHLPAVAVRDPLPARTAHAAEASAAPPILSARELHHAYSDGTQALRGVSLDLRRGEYAVLLGQNGAGKSTLVRHFLNLLRPQRGEIYLDGVDSARLSVSELAARIGYVAQNPDHQIFNDTVEGEVSFALRHLGHARAAVRDRVDESLSALGLLEVRDRHPLSLPKGDRARVVIAAVLAMQPEVLILDEPTIGQDFRGARRILDLTRSLHERGKTVLVITHHLHLMPEYAQRAVLMGRGVVLGDAPLRETYHQLDLLRQTHLTPPQAVLLAQALGERVGRALPLLTPAEVAALFARSEVE